MQRGIAEVLYSYKIENVEYSDSDHCIVSTGKIYFVQKVGEPLYHQDSGRRHGNCGMIRGKEGRDVILWERSIIWRMTDTIWKKIIYCRMMRREHIVTQYRNLSEDFPAY